MHLILLHNRVDALSWIVFEFILACYSLLSPYLDTGFAASYFSSVSETRFQAFYEIKRRNDKNVL